MTSSYTTRNRINKQGDGDNTNTWGSVLNTGALDLFDFSADGLVTIAVTAPVTLTSVNGMTDQSRGRVLKLTGSVASTITIPALEKWYLVHNASSVSQIISSSGGGTTVTLTVGEAIPVYCDATNVIRFTLKQMAAALDMGSNKITSLTDPTSNQDAATKKYVDDQAFGSTIPNFPALTGNAHRGLHVNAGETNVGWEDTASRLDPTVLAQDSAPDTAGDWVTSYDISAAAPKKVHPNSLHLPWQQVAAATVIGTPTSLTLSSIPLTYTNLILIFAGLTASVDYVPRISISVDGTNFSSTTGLFSVTLTASGNSLKGAVHIAGYSLNASVLSTLLLNDSSSASPLIAAPTANSRVPSVILATGGIVSIKIDVSTGTWTAGSVTVYAC